MDLPRTTLTALSLVVAATLGGCSSEDGTRERVESGEHDRDGGEHGRGGHGEEGEESGVELSLADRYDETRNGARLVLEYDEETNSFRGAVENTTTKTLEQVRVEVHLSNGKELGPTPAKDLAPGEKRDIVLTATSEDFERWTAHPEVGRGEHGGGEGRGEHD